MSVRINKNDRMYETLCRVLKKNEIAFEKTDGLCVCCSVGGKDGENRVIFCADCSKELFVLYAPMVSHIPQECISDVSLAICMLNNRLQDGSFCLDLSARMVYFRMTYSFYNSEPTEDGFAYMLSCAAETVERYRMSFGKLCMC